MAFFHFIFSMQLTFKEGSEECFFFIPYLPANERSEREGLYHPRLNNGFKLQENILVGISCDQRRAQQKAVDWEPIRKGGGEYSIHSPSFMVTTALQVAYTSNNRQLEVQCKSR